jgi:RNA polymerase sigma-70 factor (ECF subfamily)
MARVRDGDVGQLGPLFERHHAPLFNYFLRLTGSRPVSEDLVQEVFLRMLKYRHTYRGEGQFACWMYQIARNARTDHFRKWKPTGELPEDDAMPSHEPSASDRLEESQQHDLVRAALDRLPDDKREVLLLARYQRLRYEEIAQILGCTVGTVKVRVHRAMKDLRTTYFRLAGDRV